MTAIDMLILAFAAALIADAVSVLIRASKGWFFFYVVIGFLIADYWGIWK